MKWSSFISFAGDAGRIPCLTPLPRHFHSWFLWPLRGNSTQLSYFYYYFILTHVVSLGNEGFGVRDSVWAIFWHQYALQSVYRVPATSSGLLCLVVLIFWIALLLIHQGLPAPLFFEDSSVFKDCSWYWLVSWFSSAIILSLIRLTIHFHEFPVLVDLHKHRALILLRTRLSSGEFWEFEEIIWWDYKRVGFFFDTVPFSVEIFS